MKTCPSAKLAAPPLPPLFDKPGAAPGRFMSSPEHFPNVIEKSGLFPSRNCMNTYNAFQLLMHGVLMFN